MTEAAAGLKAKVLWDFQASEPEELSVEEDDVVTLTGLADGMWWEGELNGNTGWFPSNYVEIIQSDSDVYDYISTSSVAPIDNGAEEDDKASQQGGAISAEKNRNWYKMYKSQKKLEPKVKEDTGSSTPVTSAPISAAAEESKPEGSRIISRVITVEMPRQAKWSDDIDGSILGRLSDKEKKRQEVIFELLQTERDYVRDLDVIIELFLNPLKQSKTVTAKDAAMLFSNIESLLPINQELLRTLEEKRELYPIIQQVGDIFIRVSDYFKMYNMYCSNHPYAVHKLESIKSKQFTKFVQEQRMKPECRNLDLGSFLIKPVQRICKYPLLIREIMKFTDENHVDREALEQAFRKIEMVVTIVNEASRQAEATQKMLALQNRFIERVEIISPSRQMIREESVVMVVDGKEKDRRKLYLFNDLLLIGKVPKNNHDKLSLIANIPLDLLYINEAEGLGIELIQHAVGKFFVRTADVVTKQSLLQDLRELAAEEAARKEQERMYALEEEMSAQQAEEEGEEEAEAPPPPVDEKTRKKEEERARKEEERLRKEEEEKARKEEKAQEKARKEEEARLTKEKAKQKNSLDVTAPDDKRSSVTVSSSTSASPSPRPSMDEKSRTPSVAGPPATSPAPVRKSGTPQVEKANEVEDFRSKMGNLKKTQTPEEARASTPKDPESTLNAVKVNLRQSKAYEDVPARSSSLDEPEFKRVKLRQTRVMSETDLSPAAVDKPVTPPPSKPITRSASQPDMREQKNETKSPATKKKGFFSMFLGMFKKSKRESQDLSTNSTPSLTAKSSAASTPTTASSPALTSQSSSAPAAAKQASSTPVSQPQSRPSNPPQAKTTPAVRASVAGGPAQPIRLASVKDHRKLDTKQSTYVYLVEVIREDGSVYIIQKSYDDFYTFHSALVFQFPEEAGSRGKRRILPDLPTQSAFVSEAMAETKQRELDRYIKAIFRLPEKISKGAFLAQFLKDDPRSTVTVSHSNKQAKSTASTSTAQSKPASAPPAASSAKTGSTASVVTSTTTTTKVTSTSSSSATTNNNNNKPTPTRAAPAPPPPSVLSSSPAGDNPMRTVSVAAVRASYAANSSNNNNNNNVRATTVDGPGNYRYKPLPSKPEVPAARPYRSFK